MGRPRELAVHAGQRFGRLTAVAEVDGARRRVWLCDCDCGTKGHAGTVVNLFSGRLQSCGCLKSERTRERKTTHGMCGARDGTGRDMAYGSWTGMLDRCRNPNNQHYADYGGRGIEVCQAWQKDFAQFVKDMGPRPSRRHSIDRIDNDKGYGPGNCRWASVEEQSKNKRTTRRVTLDGVTRCIAEWCDVLGLNRARVYSRISQGWDDITALTAPLNFRIERNRR